ncbi:TPA: hypothetical protein DEO28_01560 [Candidatus Dependentiae bacterium]|nr:MAG: hypothetical protein UR14_C0004G0003 [candidate division TM6 bacterium GW2011_GWE2_31_21]KKP52921.1 MAG: hypothetical protein UR43_C0008G0003 [candidate division TM6 bacterium GW2011_GWF2_33_332]HBS47838.1 hypothetical protein [Candidatus Dependentiae bacterium]HBZ73186.1 hypothetical protein [Candidatus Dependentiae bacterium]
MKKISIILFLSFLINSQNLFGATPYKIITPHQEGKFEFFQKLIDEQKKFSDKNRMVTFLHEIQKILDQLGVKDTDLTIVNEHNDPVLYKVTKETADKLKLPMPLLFSIKTEIYNAFAVNFNNDKKFSAVFITEDLKSSLSDEELRSVMAHELGHIKKSHSKKLLAIALPTIILATIGGWLLGSWINSSYEITSENRYNVIELSVTGCMLIGAGVISYVSRKYESQADKIAAKNSNPECLITGLNKIEAHNSEVLSRHTNDRDFFIKNYQDLRVELKQEKMNPFKKLWKKFKLMWNKKSEKYEKNATIKANEHNIFSTHPATEDRIKNIKKIAEKEQSTEKEKATNIVAFS